MIRLKKYANTVGGGLVSFASARLTEKILGHNCDDLVDILKELASELGLSHIAVVCFSMNRSWDVSLMTSIATYPKEWRVRYFLRKYAEIDPVLKWGSTALLPFDWTGLDITDPSAQRFFEDASRHGIGLNGLSIPVRSRKATQSLISYVGDMPNDEWSRFKSANMKYLQQLSVLIDSAASIVSKQPKSDVQLSMREEQCLVWAARGKTHQDIAGILRLSPASVKMHLDGARHKLHCINVTHAVGVAVASGVLPMEALKDSP
jgi:LuxR family quorum-sensing system transcriptional regulator CciR